MTDEQTEKDIVNEYLEELIKNFPEEKDRYFSVPRIFKYAEERVQEKRNMGIQQNFSFSMNGFKSKNFHAILEELVKEDKALSAISDIGKNRRPYRIYRAVI